MPDFYRPDELKYHGRRNRGQLGIDFFDEVRQNIGADAGNALGFCGGEWKYPRTCSSADGGGGGDCEYVARWEYDEDRDMVDFVIKSRHVDKWTGIGFSDNPQMVRKSKKCEF